MHTRPNGSLHLNWHQTTLPTGLRLVIVPRPHTPTVAARVYVRAGSRYDLEYPRADAPDADSIMPLGLAHLVEHLLFKGTQAHTPRELFAALEQRGGTLEANTTKEYANFYTVTRPADLPTALDILAEILITPALREEDLWNEILVVVEELRRAQEREGILLENFTQTLWPTHPLRHPVLGTLHGLRALNPENTRQFYRDRYVAGNMVLVICGDVDPDAATRWAAEKFAALPPGPARLPSPTVQPPLTATRSTHLPRDTMQTHLCLGVPTVHMHHPDRSAIKVMELVLGLGGSARLHQHLRQDQQLVYSVNTVTAPYEDVGFLAVQAACAPAKAARVRAAILEEWGQLRQSPVTARELDAAKGNYAGTLARRFETNLALASIFGVEALLHQVEPLDEAVARIEAVTPAEVLSAAQKYLTPDCYVAVSLGPEVVAAV